MLSSVMMYINNLLACSCTSCDSEKDSRPVSGFSVLNDALAPKQDSVTDVATVVNIIARKFFEVELLQDAKEIWY